MARKESEFPISSFYSPEEVRELVEDLHNNLKTEIAKLETKEDVDALMAWLCSDE